MQKNSSPDFLKFGYKAGILLAFLCITTAAIYLFVFLMSSPTTEVSTNIQLLSRTAERRLLLLSTAMFIAMAFGFLGFALFLIQAKGDLDAEGSYNDYKIKFARLSPGLFVILCSTIIITFSATFRIEYEAKGNISPAEAEPTHSENNFHDTLSNASAEDMGVPVNPVTDTSKKKDSNKNTK